MDKIRWLLFRRFLLKYSIPGFSAHWSSSVDKTSSFGGFNSIGRRCRINNSSIGRFTYISADTKINRAIIGSFCSIGQECIIGGLAKHPVDWLSTHPVFFSCRRQANFSFVDEDIFNEQLDVKIGHDVWIGARVMILDGCKIGDGAIIAAGAVVNKDVPPYAIVGGVPAKLIRFRFEKNQIAKILGMKWWSWSIDELRSSPLTKDSVAGRKI